jgi:hypothetical protein
MEQVKNLGDAKPPDQVKDDDKKEIARLYKEGFIHAYRKVMLICSALAFLGAGMSFLFIKNKKLNTDAIKN